MRKKNTMPSAKSRKRSLLFRKGVEGVGAGAIQSVRVQKRASTLMRLDGLAGYLNIFHEKIFLI